jgi:Cell division protein CrgA
VASRPSRPEKHRLEGGGRTTPKGGSAKAGAAKDATAKDAKAGAAKDATAKDAKDDAATKGTAAKDGDTPSAPAKGATTSKSTSGRSTPKSTKRTTAPSASTRYTPPVPSYQKVSGPWVPALMFAFWGLGIAMILLNYAQILPGGVSNWYVFGGLGLILAGIVTATQYR